MSRQADIAKHIPLHLIRASPSKTGWSVDIGSIRWRPSDGGTPEEKRAQAYRMAFTWNLAERVPIEALEAGAVVYFYLAVDRLLEAHREGRPLDEHFAAVQRALDEHDLDPDHPACCAMQTEDGEIADAGPAEEVDADGFDVEPEVAAEAPRKPTQGGLFR